MNHPVLALLGLPGWAEMSIVGFLVLLLFAKRLPMMARAIGQTAVEFRRGLRGGDLGS